MCRKCIKQFFHFGLQMYKVNLLSHKAGLMSADCLVFYMKIHYLDACTTSAALGASQFCATHLYHMPWLRVTQSFSLGI